MEIIRSVSSFEKNPYNVSSNLSLSRARFMFMGFAKFMEVVEVMEVVSVMLHIVHYLPITYINQHES